MWCKTWALQYLIVTRISSTGGVTKVWLSLHHLSPSAPLFYSSFWVFPTHTSTQKISGSAGKRPHNCIFYLKLHIPMFTHLSLDFIPLLSQRDFPCWAHTWLYQLPCVDTAGGFGFFFGCWLGFGGVFVVGWLFKPSHISTQTNHTPTPKLYHLTAAITNCTSVISQVHSWDTALSCSRPPTKFITEIWEI